MKAILFRGVLTVGVTVAAVALTAPLAAAQPQPAEPTPTTSQQPPLPGLPQLPSNQNPYANNATSTGGVACIDGVRTVIPPEGLGLQGNHDVQPFMGQC